MLILNHYLNGKDADSLDETKTLDLVHQVCTRF